MGTVAIITTMVAVYGVGLSTALAFQQFRDRKPRLRVSLALGAAQLVPGNTSKVSLMFTTRSRTLQPCYLMLAAENTGQRVVKLRMVGFLPLNGDLFQLALPQGSSEFPRRLEPGEGCLDVWPAGDVARSLLAAEFTGTIRLGGCS